MTLLAGVNYDPSTAATSASLGSNLAMTALDTTNLRLTFTAPANGTVLVRLRCSCEGSTSLSSLAAFLGVLDGATVRGRQLPLGGLMSGATGTNIRMPLESMFLVTGLTPSTSYTWDAAYGVEIAVASASLRWGGPDNATSDDAYGGFVFEIYDTPTLLAGKHYDPASAVSPVTSALAAMTAFDTTNLRLTFTAPSSGNVLVRIRVAQYQGGSGSFGQMLFGVLDGATVRARGAPVGAQRGALTASELLAPVTGLTPSSSYTWDAAYSCDVVSTSTGWLSYGGPNNTTASDAAGGLAFEIWSLN